MSLVFRYRLGKSPGPVLPLAGRTSRPRPLVAVGVIGPKGAWASDALLDTGADDTVFPQFAAGAIGIDLTNAPVGQGSGAAASPVLLRYAWVTLRIITKQEQREWPAWVGFTAAPLRQPLLGYAGFLQFFDAFFYGAREEVELSVNPLYPGT